MDMGPRDSRHAANRPIPVATPGTGGRLPEGCFQTRLHSIPKNNTLQDFVPVPVSRLWQGECCHYVVYIDPGKIRRP